MKERARLRIRGLRLNFLSAECLGEKTRSTRFRALERVAKQELDSQ
jgi:hypothetical protein